MENGQNQNEDQFVIKNLVNIDNNESQPGGEHPDTGNLEALEPQEELQTSRIGTLIPLYMEMYVNHKRAQQDWYIEKEKLDIRDFVRFTEAISEGAAKFDDLQGYTEASC